MNHQVQGEGPALIVMHGLFGSLSNWKYIARNLAQHYKVVSVDLRNHGRSPWSEDNSYVAMVSDLVDLMDHLGIASADLLGHSMGGKVAMAAALSKAERINGIVVVDIAPVDYPHSHIDLIDTLLGVDVPSLRGRKDFDAAVLESIPEPGLRMFLSQNLVAAESGYRWRINLPALKSNMSELTSFPVFSGSYQGHALFLWGGQSDYVGPTREQPIKALFPNARLIEFPGCGHWLHAEQPKQLIEAVHGFLN